MTRDIKSVRPGRGVRCVHVETPLGIVNVWLNLRDELGRRVEKVEMIPNQYAGEPKVTVRVRRFVELKGVLA